jgi:hypothetical protein
VSGLLVGFDGQAPLRSVSGQTGAADDAKDFLVPLNEHTETARGGLFPCACERHLKPEGHALPDKSHVHQSYVRKHHRFLARL